MVDKVFLAGTDDVRYIMESLEKIRVITQLLNWIINIFINVEFETTPLCIYLL